jgi:hypothetical protein
VEEVGGEHGDGLRVQEPVRAEVCPERKEDLM